MWATAPEFLSPGWAAQSRAECEIVWRSSPLLSPGCNLVNVQVTPAPACSLHQESLVTTITAIIWPAQARQHPENNNIEPITLVTLQR